MHPTKYLYRRVKDWKIIRKIQVEIYSYVCSFFSTFAQNNLEIERGYYASKGNGCDYW